MFKFENDLLKHHIRVNGWLPACKQRLKAIRATGNPKHLRRLKYFTFCAVGAIDVLMLDVARIIRRSNDKRFDTVVFFDLSREDVVQTQKRIPGAIGFPGDFIEVVLCDEVPTSIVIDQLEPLKSPENESDSLATRELQLLFQQQQQFKRYFPFDVINLDLEEYLFKPKENLPGSVTNAMRKIFEWQTQPLTNKEVTNHYLDGFSLMFTTQVGPPGLTPNYRTMLYNYLDENMRHDEQLRPLLVERSGFDNIDALQDNDYEAFFKLGVPKMLAHILLEQDWFIDPEYGLQVYEFERPATPSPYTMIHIVMQVRRQNPPRKMRAPGTTPPEAGDGHRKAVKEIFSAKEIIVAEDSIDQAALSSDLELIKARRRKYNPEGDQN